MARTNFPPPEPTTRTLPVDIHYATHCYWPCPCGGTVPDAPDYCKFSKHQSRAKTNCTDVLCCVANCEHVNACPAYKAYQTRMQILKINDNLRAAELERKRKEEGK